MATALNIQPEAFEFEAEFGEYEDGQPQPSAATACPPYQRGEVEKSWTQQGHLPSDVIQHPRGLGAVEQPDEEWYRVDREAIQYPDSDQGRMRGTEKEMFWRAAEEERGVRREMWWAAGGGKEGGETVQEGTSAKEGLSDREFWWGGGGRIREGVRGGGER